MEILSVNVFDINTGLIVESPIHLESKMAALPVSQMAYDDVPAVFDFILPRGDISPRLP